MAIEVSFRASGRYFQFVLDLRCATCGIGRELTDTGLLGATRHGTTECGDAAERDDFGVVSVGGE